MILIGLSGTLFTISAQDGGTNLEMVMDIHPHSLIAKVTTPFITGMIAKAIEEDLDAVKSYCESQQH